MTTLPAPVAGVLDRCATDGVDEATWLTAARRSKIDATAGPYTFARDRPTRHLSYDSLWLCPRSSELPFDGDLRVSTLVADVRLAVYKFILETGRVPLVAQVADRLSMALDDVRAEFRRLQNLRAFALAPASDEILMAHPFSAVPTAYVVRSGGRAFWANCAWDALAIPAMLGADAALEARCADCGDAIVFTFSAGKLEPHPAVIHFAVPPRRFWDNVVFT